MAPFLEEKKKKRMMNAIGMFIVTEILQAWIPSTGLDAGYYDNLNYRKWPPFYQAVFSPRSFQAS